MKKLILINSFLILFGYLSAQTPTNYSYYSFTFEDTVHHNSIIIPDSQSIWQIGAPNKSVFDSAHSPTNVICTDLTNPYPPNNTSSFIVYHKAEIGWSTAGYGWDFIGLSGWYYCDSDSINDYSTIELSLDKGLTWMDIFTDTLINKYVIWHSPNFTFTGQSNGWKQFYLSFQFWAFGYPNYLPNINLNDTIIYRFSFISDSIDNGGDGIMFDDLEFSDFVGNISEISHTNKLLVYPNPVDDKINIQFKNINQDFPIKIKIYNSTGNLVKTSIIKQQESSIDVRDLDNGIYLIRAITNKNEIQTNKVVVLQ